MPWTSLWRRGKDWTLTGLQIESLPTASNLPRIPTLDGCDRQAAVSNQLLHVRNAPITQPRRGRVSSCTRGNGCGVCARSSHKLHTVYSLDRRSPSDPLCETHLFCCILFTRRKDRRSPSSSSTMMVPPLKTSGHARDAGMLDTCKGNISNDPITR